MSLASVVLVTEVVIHGCFEDEQAVEDPYHLDLPSDSSLVTSSVLGIDDSELSNKKEIEF